MKPVAPRWHTLLLIALFLGITVGGAVLHRGALSRPEVQPDVVPIYVSMILAELGLFLYVWRAGLRRSGTTLREVIGGRWGSSRDVLVDVALAIGLWGLWTLIDLGWDRFLGPGDAVGVGKLLPHKPVEVILWVVVATCAGFCEELVFRGYFQRQFTAYTRHAWIALLLQGALFGISHGYQGSQACLKIALYGALFGVLALWRRSLRPGMMAHAWTDILAGLFRI
jgi:hypothetical protein